MKKGAKSRLFNMLSDSELEKIHQGSLLLLEKEGIYSESDLIMDVFKKGGANVDTSARVIKIPRNMVEESIKSAPSSFVLHGRDPGMDILLEPERIYFGMGGSPEPFIWDYNEGQKRTPTKKDMEECTKLGEALSNIDFVGAICSAGDKPEGKQLFHEYDALLRNTSKPLLYSAPSRYHVQKFMEMAAIASGGEEELRKRPSIGIFTETVSPMKVAKYSDGTIDAAQAGIPVIVALAPMMGATSPATKAGTLVQGNAEALFGVVLAQLVKSGAPVIYGPGTGTFDMSISEYTYASPEQTAARTVVAQLGKFYKLPTYNLGGAAESKMPDAEAGAQAMMGMLMNALSGITLTKVMGTLASGMYGSKEMLVICDEIAHMVKEVLKGVTVNNETLALDVIRKVGFQGNYLEEDHTAENFRKEFFIPENFKRQSISAWEKEGKKSILDVANEKVSEILASSEPVRLPQNADKELEKSLAEAEKFIGKN